MLSSIPCLFSSVLHFNMPSMITANQLLLSISRFKCVVLLLDIFNNYPRLRSTKTPTGRLHGCSGFRFICCVVNSAVNVYWTMIKVFEQMLCMYLKTISPDVPRFTFVCSGFRFICCVVNSAVVGYRFR